MDTVTLRQHGDEVGFMLPDELRQRLGHEAGEELTVVEVPDGLKLIRHDAELELQIRLAQEVLEEQAETLKTLAIR